MADGRTTRDKASYYFKDLTGKRFGRLVAVEKVGCNKHGNLRWLCRCDCGNEKIVTSGKLIQQRTRSCGCYAKEVRTKSLEKHGITTGGKPRTLTIWNGMKARCFNPKSPSYKNYGGRGITICNEWLSFENFHNWSIENGYAEGLQIDRIDNDGNYEPSNCRWVSRKDNMKNTSRCHFVQIHGEKKTITEWIELTGISRS